MIPQISEINFPAYATLHEATVSFSNMGERTITTQVRIDGDIVPSFEGWELEFKGERFVLPIRDPQARKDNTTRNSLVDLTFYSWPIYEMKRYFFFETTTTATGTVMADKYKASVNLNLVNFVALFNRVLNFYFGGKVVADLASGSFDSKIVSVQIDYSYIWDVLQSFYELYGVQWRIEYNANSDVYKIKIGYSPAVIDNHDFEYGFEGGLLHFERQVEDDNIKNILLGRGGDRNIPYRYFKRADPNNPGWAADPDAIKELENIYFDRLMDHNFRCYVQGWKTNPRRLLYPGESVLAYDSSRGATDWAYKKGHEDLSFNPVEYVKDDESIVKYGERWGALEDNDDIYPTIQGVSVSGKGRIDEVVDVSTIITDDIQGNMESAASIVSIDGVLHQSDNIPANDTIHRQIRGGNFSVPAGETADIRNNGWFVTFMSETLPQLSVDTTQSRIRVFDSTTNEELIYGDQGLQTGTYYYIIDITVNNYGSTALNGVTFGVHGLDLIISRETVGTWKPTFDIWIKNLFDSERLDGESDEEYSLRVWGPILGDRLGNEAKVVFSDGPMSISEDYEFTIAAYPVPDNTKVTAGGYRSEWKVTLYKSDAEFNVSGLYVPNNTSGGKPVAGNHFFFVGIDMPHMYVTLGEERLTQYKTLALNGMLEINPTWVIHIDKVRADMVNSDNQRLFDQISSGCEMHVKDRRFTGGQVLTLYANSITYTWHEPSDDNPYILPDIEIVVSDRIVVEKSTTEKMLGDIEEIKRTYAKLSDINALVPELTASSFLKKNGEEDISVSPTRFASIVASRDFVQGAIGGRGWGFYRDNSSKFQNSADQDAPTDSVLEVDKVVVRKEMQVNNLVVNQISSIGGKQIYSAASMECIQVVETDDSYVCYFDQKQDTIKNLFAVGDIAMGQVFTADNFELRYYKMIVTATDVDSITLAKQSKVGSGYPKKGDIIAQYGNISNPARQYVIIRDVIGGGYDKMISGLNSINATGTEYYFAGYDPSIQGAKKGRFYIGGEDSHAEFKESDGKFILKGALNVSPSGDTFPAITPRGDYDSETEYFWGDLVTYNGASYLFISEISATGQDPETATSYWQKYIERGEAGANGYNNAIIYLYKRSASEVSVDWTDTLTFTFASNILSPVPTGWSRNIPSGDDPLYVTAATACANTDTDEIAYTEWSEPIIMSKDGENGLNSATVTLYRRAASTPSKPSATLTYTFSTGVLSGSLSNWSQTIPADNGNTCYMIQATAVSTGDTDTIASSEWSAVRAFVKSGEDGTISKFQWAKKLTSDQPSSGDWVNSFPSDITGYYVWQRQSVLVGGTWHALDGTYTYQGERPNTVGIVHDPTAFNNEQTSREELAKTLGYDSWADFEEALSQGQVIIEGGYLRADLIETQVLIARLLATGIAGDRVEISGNNISIKDADNVTRLVMGGDVSYSSISNFAAAGTTQTVSVTSIDRTIPIVFSVAPPASGSYWDAAVAFDTGIVTYGTQFTLNGIKKFNISGPSVGVSIDSLNNLSSVISSARVSLYVIDSQNNAKEIANTTFDSIGTAAIPRALTIEPITLMVGTYHFGIRVSGNISAKTTLTTPISRIIEYTTSTWQCILSPVDEHTEMFVNGFGYKHDQYNYNVALYSNGLEWGVSRGSSSGKEGISLDSDGLRGYFGTNNAVPLMPIFYCAKVYSRSSAGTCTKSNEWCKTGGSGTFYQYGTSSATNAYFTLSLTGLPTNAVILITTNHNESDAYIADAYQNGTTVTIKLHGANTTSNSYARDFSIMILAL